MNRKKYFDDSAGISLSRERLKAHIRFGLNEGSKSGIRKIYLNDVFVIYVFVSLDIIFLYNFWRKGVAGLVSPPCEFRDVSCRVYQVFIDLCGSEVKNFYRPLRSFRQKVIWGHLSNFWNNVQIGQKRVSFNGWNSTLFAGGRYLLRIHGSKRFAMEEDAVGYLHFDFENFWVLRYLRWNIMDFV